ncbi:MAG: MFS transporter [Gammaproteobacteria bacterium]|nr:MFS transporter [Gammaproteobacteria bacterium]
MAHSLKRSWLVCLTAGLFFFYEFFQLNVFDVINPNLLEAFQIQATQLSWLSSTFIWTNVLFLLPAGFILDRFPMRAVILSAMLACIIGTFGFALTHSFIWAALFHGLTGIGNAFCFLACVVLVSRWFPPQKQALVIGCIVTMAFLGGMMAHTPFAYLEAKFGWRTAMLLDGVLGIVFISLIAMFVYNPKQQTPPRSISNTWLKDIRHASGNLQNWIAGIYTACLNLPIMVLCALWGGSYLQQVHHLSRLVSSNIVSLIFIGSILGCPFMGWLSDKQRKRKPIMIGGALITGITLIPLCLPLSLSTYELAVIFFALGLFTSTQVISYPLITESNPATNTGSATGLASVLIMGSAGLAQILFGWLMEYHSHAAAISTNDFRFAFWIFPITTFVAFLAGILLRETNCKSFSRSNHGHGA